MAVDVAVGMDDEDEECAYESTGNIFADLDHADAAEMHARSQLMMGVTAILRERKLSAELMAELLGTTQPVVANLMRGKLHEFSIGQLFAFLEALGHDVELTVHPRKPMKRVSLRRATTAR